ncbi:MAG: type II toxin-antitoxin system VapC family toxin [bacterium]|nr:type II toxin-antitoxin system VapC family toxin [bacterium]
MENRGILVDTSILIDFFRKTKKENSVLYTLQQNRTLYISTVTEFEFLAGVKEDNIRSIKHFFAGLNVLDFDSNSSVIASRIYKTLRSKNLLIEFRDIFIGATALAWDLELVTLNLAHFKRIDELRLLPLPVMPQK